MPGISLGTGDIGGKKRQTCHCSYRGHYLVGEIGIKQTTKITRNMCCARKKYGAVIKNNSRGDAGSGNLLDTLQGKPFQGDI